MPKTLPFSPREAAALARARRALAKGAFAEVAQSYEQAARARDQDGADGARHWRRALDFWVAARVTSRGLLCAERLLRRRSIGAERGPIDLARGQLQLIAGRPRAAMWAFAQARRSLGRDRDRRRLALMGEAEAKIALGEVHEARA